ncbi:unnamed protein product [Staurois parvus]|uniref:Uncharacterized protein n=1 Tax=Staurois parvus TaxID=386267 RepID=A0ABN9DX89_9NEOB|nr:unnamed protein product [Staurois parvus]
MSTDRWHCWGYTDHQGTLIISALMITDYRLSSPLLCQRDSSRGEKCIFPCLHVISCDWTQLIT